jgi:hypothetical protein
MYLTIFGFAAVLFSLRDLSCLWRETKKMMEEDE